MQALNNFFLYCILLICYSLSVTAQRSYIFIENKNQWPEKVLFKANIPDGTLWLEKNCLTYNFVKRTDLEKSCAHHNAACGHNHQKDNTINYHAYKVHFENSRLSDVKIKPEETALDYCNFYIGRDRSKWASRVKKYDVVNYENLYQNIDMKIHVSEGKFKYDFIVAPYANPSVITLRFEGHDSIFLDNNDLIIRTSVNELSELKPYAYTEKNGIKKEVSCFFKLDGSKLSFIFPEGYDKSAKLVIDPVLIFSTYTGSTTDNWGFTATYDNYGNVFSGGIVESGGYPVSTGAFQITNGGLWDVGIIKYTPDGTTKIYATYLGGNSSDMPHSLVVNEYNELHVFGTTGSDNFPMLPGSYDSTFNGGLTISYDWTVIFSQGTDIFVAKLSEDGTNLLGSTYIGGSANDGLNYKPHMDTNGALMHGSDSLYYNYADGARGEIICDSKNNVYIGTCTFSSDFPTTSGAFQQTHSGKQEGVVFKLNSNLSQLVWSSYIGGSEDDAVYSVDVDSNFDVYVAGGTVSHNFPTTPGVLNQNFLGGNTDGFVAHITESGNQLVKSTYFGSNMYDQAYFVRLDKYNNVYISGQTEATGNTLIYNAAYNTPNSGQFIAKINNDLNTLLWSTVFGTGSGKPNISLTAFTVDVCNRIYLSGWGRIWGDYIVDGVTYTWGTTFGTVGMEVTPNAHQSVTDGQDFYIMVLADDASALEYATFFGEQHYASCNYSGHDHVDGGTSRFDRKGNIYQSVCASCGGCQQFPTYPHTGSSPWSSTNNSYNCNNAVFRFSFMDDFSIADFILPPTGCAPYIVNFQNTSLGTNYLWDFGDSTTSTDENPVHTYAGSGTYNITLIASDPGTCNLADTIVKQIQIISNNTDSLAMASVCPADSVQIGVPPGVDPNITYHWTPETGLSNPDISNPWAYFSSSPVNYILTITNGTCIDTFFQTVNPVIGNYSIAAINDTTICEGGSVTLSANSPNQTVSYLWNTQNSFNTHINTNTSTSVFVVQPQGNTTYYIQGIGVSCEGMGVDSISVFVNQVPILAGTDSLICLGDTINLHVTNLNPSNTLSYSWSPGAAIVSGGNTNAPLVSPVVPTNFLVTATSQHNCSRVDTVSIAVDMVSATISGVGFISCYNECDGSATVSTGGIPPFSFLWNNNQTSQTALGLCDGLYTVTITDSIGCKAVTNVSLSEPSELIPALVVTPIIDCNGYCTGQIIASVSGGTPGYYYFWSNDMQNDTVSALCVGNYNVTITDAHGCDTILSAQIVDPSDMATTVTQGSSISCYGYCDGAVSASATGGNPPFIYTWNNGSHETFINNLCSGLYVVTVMDNEGCIRVVPINVLQPQALNPFIIASTAINCHNDTATLSTIVSNGFPPYTFQWNDLQQQTTQVIHGVLPGSYQVIVTDSHNCSDTAIISLPNPELLVADTLFTHAACTFACNGTISINPQGGTSPYLVTWSDNGSGMQRQNLCNGDYYATVTDVNGCRILYHFLIDTLDYAPPLDATADHIVIYRGRTTTLHANGLTNAYYIWEPETLFVNNNLTDPVVSPLNTTLFEVWTTDSLGCKNRDTITIFVNDVFCAEPYIFVPNSFTPNGDGNNDLLYLYTNMADDVYLAIYDRWGNKVFETTSIAQGWDGTYNGKPCDPAVFVYHLKVRCLNEEIF
ncbi:MAG TPA: hypothetical protein DEH02_03980, partial [Bacteroidales bacterium]|nr:hypothetical protein [Bacteroidales bacterium]